MLQQNSCSGKIFPEPFKKKERGNYDRHTYAMHEPGNATKMRKLPADKVRQIQLFTRRRGNTGENHQDGTDIKKQVDSRKT